MNFDWQEYYKLAAELYSPSSNLQANEEARLRACISRAYYSALNFARIRVLGIGYKAAGQNSHNQTIHDLQSKGATRAALNLGRMKEARLRADYDDPNFQQIRKHAEKILLQAKEVLESV